MIIQAQTGLYGDGFLASPNLCGKQVWDYYGQSYGQMIHVGTDRPCSANAVYRAFFRIDLSSITGDVVAATVNFHLAGKTSPSAGVLLYEIADFGQLDYGDWSYSQRADLGTVITTGTATGWISVDVTARVQAAITASLTHIAFMFIYQAEGSISQNHWYAISAAESGNGPYLDVTEQAIGEAPTDLAAYIVGGPKVVLQWTDPNSGAAQEDGYHIERDVDGGGFSQIAVTDPDATTYTDADVADGHTYTYRVFGRNSAGDTSYSAEAVATKEYSGTPKPIPLGWCYNIEPVLIDEDNHIYQYGDEAVAETEAVDAVYVAGLEVTTGFTLDTVNSKVTFDEDPGGQVTLDVRGVKDDGVFISLAGDLVSWVLRALGGVIADDLVAEDFAQINRDLPYPMGLYITEQTGIQEVIDSLLSGTLTHCGPIGEGEWNIRQCLAAGGEPDLELTSEDILDIKVEPLNINPIWRCTIKGNRNWTPNSNPADTVSASRRSWLKDQYRRAAAEDSGIKTLYPMAEEAGPHETCLARTADCALLAQTRVDVSGTQRLKVTVLIKLQGQKIWPGYVVKITHEKWGLDGGRLGRVLRVSKTHAPVGIKIEAMI
ncbi:MAG: DNRLRE domain-containing protein [Desulfarculaceae bacterium]|nr:DNRLRE domain-containing protein [Desulfarculaceae bacterium]